MPWKGRCEHVLFVVRLSVASRVSKGEQSPNQEIFTREPIMTRSRTGFNLLIDSDVYMPWKGRCGTINM